MCGDIIREGIIVTSKVALFFKDIVALRAVRIGFYETLKRLTAKRQSMFLP